MITRRQTNRFVLGFLIVAITPRFVMAQAPAATPLNDPAIEARVAALLKQMTLEEKVGQLNQFSSGAATGPGTGRSEYGQMVANGQIGSILNLTGAKETNNLQRIAMTKSRLKIPILFGLDVIHGYRTVFPVPLGLAATWNPELIEKAARVAGREAAAEGVRWTFSPMVDIARDARWGRIVEGAGEDPYLGSVLAAAYVRGYQGTRLDDPSSIAACAKHYVGYGAAEGGRDYNTTEISERSLRQVYLPPFHASVNAGAATLMSAFNSLNGVPTSANPFTLDQVLRRDWGFRGFVVSDWTSVKELIAHGIGNDGATVARRAVQAGVDMDMEGALYLNELPAQVKSGKVSEAVIDEAVRRILRVKFALGLFDRPYVEESVRRESLDPDHVELARTAAEQSLVLLKNDTGSGQTALLPLDKTVRKIALVGPLADSAGHMLGPWAAKGDPKHAVTLRAALEEFAAKRQMQVVYDKGAEIIGGPESGIASAVEIARSADLVLLALGEHSGDMTAEAASRAFITLPGLQQNLLEAVVATRKPVVLILFTGRPLALTNVVDKVPALVQAWYPGVQAGPALVRALSGETDFSGRLTVSMPRSVGQLPLYYNHLNTGRPSGKVDLTRPPTSGDEKYVSRYIDELNAPLFPFGYGLSYSNFEYSGVKLSANSLSASALNSGSQTLQVTVDVKNAGNRESVAVPQLYINLTGTSVARPVRELKGFQRIVLKPGESRRVEFTLGKNELAFWNIDMKEVVESAALKIWVSQDSQSGTPAELTIRD